MNDAYAYWRAALAASQGRGEWPPIHEGDPQPGYYRKRARKGGPWLPVAIWERDGELVATVDGKPVAPAEIWTWVADKPVAYEDFRERTETGRWPGEAPEPQPAPAIGHNQPPSDPLEIMRARIEEQVRLVEDWLELHQNEVRDQAEADQLADMLNTLRELAKEADAERKREKQPHLDACREVDGRWRPVIERPKVLASQAKRLLTAWLRKRREEEKAQAKAALDAGAKEVKASPAAGHAKRKVVLRTRKVAVIEDWQATTLHFIDSEELRAVVQKLANAAVRSGQAVPGVRVETEETAA